LGVPIAPMRGTKSFGPAEQRQIYNPEITVMSTSDPTEQPRAQMVLSACGNAAEALERITSTSATALADELKSAIVNGNGRALGDVEGRRYAKAVMLDSLFHNSTQDVFRDPSSAEEFAPCMGLALRAQAQSPEFGRLITRGFAFLACLTLAHLPPRCSRRLPPFQPSPIPCPQLLIIPVSIR
jgi:hypothetical protein